MGHDQFDYQTPYTPWRYDVLTLTGLSDNSTLRLTIVTCDLPYSRSWWPPWRKTCEGYLEVSSIRGYPNNKGRFCGYRDLAGTTHNLLPINNKIIFTFVTRKTRKSTGFSLKYEGNFKLFILHESLYPFDVC